MTPAPCASPRRSASAFARGCLAPLGVFADSLAIPSALRAASRRHAALARVRGRSRPEILRDPGLAPFVSAPSRALPGRRAVHEPAAVGTAS